MSENDKVIEELRRVPEVQLSLVSLAWKVCPRGVLDAALLTLHAMEMTTAVKEAEIYARHTKEAVWGLTNLARSNF